MRKKLKGLSDSEVIASREKYGNNALEKEKTQGFFRKFLENLSDPIIKVLLIAVAIEVAVSFRNCNWFEVGGIVLAILIATTVSTVSEYGSEKAFIKMQEQDSTGLCTVWRNGVAVSLKPDQIVVGDLMIIEKGEMIMADAHIIEGAVSVDQSALNGESKEVLKSAGASDNRSELSAPSSVFKGTLVLSGSATAVVTGVGKSTYYGMVAKDVQTETRESPLKIRLSKLASQISRLGYVLAAIVGLTYLFFAFVVDNGYDVSGIIGTMRDIPFVLSTLSHAMTLMITVIVVAVPEGLPMMITVVLSANMKKMISDNVMVKKLVGIETTGSMNVLFTDKTGTLTTGKTSVDRIVCADREYKSLDQLRKSREIYDILNISANYATAEGNSGNSTDKALCRFFEGERRAEATVVAREEFSSDKKYSSVRLSGGSVIYRGAPEIILAMCSSVKTSDGRCAPISKSSLEGKYNSFAQKGERVIAVAVADGDSCAFVSFIVLKDKLRPEASEAVSKMLSAGVSVVMITGDGRATATAIAEECGIITDKAKDTVITHDELCVMSDTEVKAILPRLKVLARALPQDKIRLVRLSQELDLVVGMTGDGINDAPSLKLADVGFAMGSGTDIAKSAADIVILDDSFLAITKTVLYGRTIFKSIRKFITFQLMMNIIASGVSLVGQFMGFESPITIIQMLWVNIIMDTLGGLAFAGEPPLDYYMLEPPKKREERILSADMLHQILFTGLYSLLICVIFLRLELFRALFRASDGDAVFMTAFYALFIFMGIFNCFNARSERLSLLSNIERNPAFLIVMGLIVCVQLVMIYFGGELFRSVPLTVREILNVVLISSSVIVFDAIRRVFKKLTK